LDSITGVPSVFAVPPIRALPRVAKVQLRPNERQRVLGDHQFLVGGMTQTDTRLFGAEIRGPPGMSMHIIPYRAPHYYDVFQIWMIAAGVLLIVTCVFVF
jgi:hypothetical protein